MTLTVLHLGKSFDNNDIFRDFSIEFSENSVNCILGPSGCGKTTLLNIIAGIDNDYSGEVLQSESIAYIFQEPRLLKWKTAGENILLNSDNKDLAERIAEMSGLSDKWDNYPFELSGGMKQRVNIARAFTANSDILLMDEPFKSLDYILKNRLIDIFLALLEEYPKTVIFVTHNIEEASMLAEQLFIFSYSPIESAVEISFDSHQPDIMAERINTIKGYLSKKL
ncbi:MAG: ABC transporter ATP-binding protein [bacterium]